MPKMFINIYHVIFQALLIYSVTYGTLNNKASSECKASLNRISHLTVLTTIVGSVCCYNTVTGCHYVVVAVGVREGELVVAFGLYSIEILLTTYLLVSGRHIYTYNTYNTYHDCL